jgi:sporulation protein YlmC with PRC-barrel domain
VSRSEQIPILESSIIMLEGKLGRLSYLHQEKSEFPVAEPRLARSQHIVPAKKVIGSDVIDANSEYLGVVEDLVVDAGAGRIVYAVLSFGGVIGRGDKCFAIPWSSFQFHLPEVCVVLNVDKKLLESAPGFHRGDWPDMTDSTWGTSIHKHYGLAPYGEDTTGDRR